MITTRKLVVTELCLHLVAILLPDVYSLYRRLNFVKMMPRGVLYKAQIKMF